MGQTRQRWNQRAFRRAVIDMHIPDWEGHEHNIAPTAAGRGFFGDFTAAHPAFATGIGLEVEARPGAQVLATTTLPWPAPDPWRCSRWRRRKPIHSGTLP